MSVLASAAEYGGQPERTALSWQRTALASATGAAIIARHSAGTLGPVSVVILLATLALAGTAFVLGRRRYALSPGEPTRHRDGRAPAALSLAVVTMALTELLALVLKGASA